jgi:hypothetical protein
MKNVLKLTVLIVVCFACTKKVNLEDRFNELIKASNNFDVEGQLSLYSDSAIYSTVGFYSKFGKDELRTLFELSKPLNIKTFVTNINAVGDTVFARSKSVNKFDKLCGIDTLYSTIKCVYNKERLIQYFFLQVEKASIDSIISMQKNVIVPFIGWVQKEKGETIFKKIKIKDKPEISGANINVWMDLITEWKNKKD